MPELWVLALVAVVFILYVVAKVYSYNKQSKAEWGKVDKTRLKRWDDDDRW